MHAVFRKAHDYKRCHSSKCMTGQNQAIKSDELSVDLWGCHPQEEHKINIEDSENQSQRR